MTAEYKFYHGSVLIELLRVHAGAIEIEEMRGDGRAASYRLDRHVCIYIKHASQRLRPWPFTFSPQNIEEWESLRLFSDYQFIVLACHTDGTLCLSQTEVASVLEIRPHEQSWLRVDRPKRQWYSVYGGGGGPIKTPKGLAEISRILQEKQGDFAV